MFENQFKMIHQSIDHSGEDLLGNETNRHLYLVTIGVKATDIARKLKGNSVSG